MCQSTQGLIFCFWTFITGFSSPVEAPSGLPDPEDRPVLTITGVNSRIEKEGAFRIGNQKDWEVVWFKHLGKTQEDFYKEHLPSMEVDFSLYELIAVFGGPKVNRRGIRVESVKTRDSEKDKPQKLVIRIEDISYQVAFSPLGNGQKPPESPKVYPYAFILIPRSPHPIRIEEGFRNLKAEPNQWKEKATLVAKP